MISIRHDVARAAILPIGAMNSGYCRRKHLRDDAVIRSHDGQIARHGQIAAAAALHRAPAAMMSLVTKMAVGLIAGDSNVRAARKPLSNP